MGFPPHLSEVCEFALLVVAAVVVVVVVSVMMMMMVLLLLLLPLLLQHMACFVSISCWLRKKIERRECIAILACQDGEGQDAQIGSPPGRRKWSV